MNPKVLVLDEPLSGLDTETEEWLTVFCQKKNPAKTMIIATHNHKFAGTVADRIVFMDRDHHIDHIWKRDTDL